MKHGALHRYAIYDVTPVTAERAGVTEPAATARSKPANALQKYIEVVGIRLVQDAKKKQQARFVVVNHSNAGRKLRLELTAGGLHDLGRGRRL